MINWPEIIDQLNSDAGLGLKHQIPRSISGGCINQAYALGGNHSGIFIKLNDRAVLPMFEAEADGLTAMANADAIRIPQVHGVGCAGSHSYIAMEFIHSSRANNQGYEQFGRQLAKMHRYQADRYGADVDNTIGSTPQVNQQENDWFEFWRIHRLGYQLDLARHNGAPSDMYETGMRLAECFDQLFQNQPPAACLHGDLWQGNWGFDDKGNPFIFDPAHYFGDREADLAMTHLFGGAPNLFYQSYHEAYPLEEGYQLRGKFYNIYHVLNHFNLFGGGYAAQAKEMIAHVLSELS